MISASNSSFQSAAQQHRAVGQPPVPSKTAAQHPPLFVCVAIQNIAQASNQVHPHLQQQTWIDTPSILALQASRAHKHEQRANARLTHF